MAPLSSLSPLPSSPLPCLGRSAPRPSPVAGVRSPSSPCAAALPLSPLALRKWVSPLPPLRYRCLVLVFGPWGRMWRIRSLLPLPRWCGDLLGGGGGVACAAPRLRKFAPGGRGRPVVVSPSVDGWIRISRRRRKSGKCAVVSPAPGILGCAPDGELGGSPSPSPSPSPSSSLAAVASSPVAASAGPAVAPCTLDPDLSAVASGLRACPPCGPDGPIGAVLASGPPPSFLRWSIFPRSFLLAQLGPTPGYRLPILLRPIWRVGPRGARLARAIYGSHAVRRPPC